MIRLYPEGQIPEVLWLNDFEFVERSFVTAYLQHGMRVVNVGANVGLYSILASVLVGEQGRVYAFEPGMETYARLLRNIALNACRNITAEQLALSDSAGTLVLRADPYYPSYDGHRFVERVDQAGSLLQTDEFVVATTLDAYFATQKDQKVDFIIMDIEGAEFAVLQGSAQTLTQSNPTMLLECSKNRTETGAVLQKFGYKFWVWDMHKRALISTDFAEAARVGNVVVRREGWAQ